MSANTVQSTNFYNVKDVFAEKYYQLPMVFFTNEKYKKMRLDAKVAYALLKDRFSYSVKNNWIDEDGNIYFIFTNKELSKLLQCNEKTLIKIKKELVQKNLLVQKRIGLNKPNHLYLLRPEVSSQDVYLINNRDKNPEKEASALQPQGTVKNAVPEKEASALQPQGTVKNAVPEKEASALQPQGTVKNTANLDYIILDTNKIHTNTSLDFSSKNYSQQEQQKQNSDLVHSAASFMTKTDEDGSYILNHDATAFLGAWCKTPGQMHQVVGIILNAKKAVEQDMQKQRPNDNETDILNISKGDSELKNLIGLTLKRYFNAIKVREENGNPIRDYEGYLYRTMQNMFWLYVNKHSATLN
ncbi:replication initiator protein A [Lactobacillus taiwanensis]|uniref:replication initiator protein A n=1 Tax=Lactobacillus taiwanensis TaxID=508451 RepID=UPI002729FB18|nr:replication initiator protein A [Lactobacillus taiwanensis]